MSGSQTPKEGAVPTIILGKYYFDELLGIWEQSSRDLEKAFDETLRYNRLKRLYQKQVAPEFARIANLHIIKNYPVAAALALAMVLCILSMGLTIVLFILNFVVSPNLVLGPSVNSDTEIESRPSDRGDENGDSTQVSLWTGGWENIYFDPGGYTLRPEAKASLNDLAALLREDSTLIVFVFAYADSTLSPSIDNKVLADRRAKIIEEYVEQRGIHPDRVNAGGEGIRRPNETPEDRASNRRAEIFLYRFAR